MVSSSIDAKSSPGSSSHDDGTNDIHTSSNDDNKNGSNDDDNGINNSSDDDDNGINNSHDDGNNDDDSGRRQSGAYGVLIENINYHTKNLSFDQEWSGSSFFKGSKN